MSRAEERKLQSNTGNEFTELLRINQHYFKKIAGLFKEIEDPRHTSYTKYEVEEILLTVLMKNMCSIKSMKEMTREFNTDEAVANLGMLTGKEDRDQVPHYETINEFLEKLPPEALEEVRTKMLKELLKKRSFESSRLFNQDWIVVIDGTQLFHFREKHCEHCLTREKTDKITGEKTVHYYHQVLEAKIILGDHLLISLATEFIENDGEDAKRQANLSVEKLKQDCELKAFKRLAKKVKNDFPRLPICILGDSLYANETVFDICDKNNWNYLIRFKDGSIPSVASEFRILKDGDYTMKNGRSQWVNQISYNQREVNVLEYREETRKGLTVFKWITELPVNEKKIEELVVSGRKRWKIENEGFNNQKNHRYDITHANSMNYNAMKNHYLLVQIADIIMQLYDEFAPAFRKIKQTIKKKPLIS